MHVWKYSPITLTIEEGSNVITLAANAAGLEPKATTLEDFAPRRFDEIILCAGPDDNKAWPGDIVLLKRAMKSRRRKEPKTPGDRPAPQRKAVGITAVAGSIACTLLLGTFATLVTQTAHHAAAKVPPVPAQLRVLALLEREGYGNLRASEADRKVVVHGLVPGTVDVARVRATLQRFDGEVVHRYAAASEIARTIGEALGDRMLNVSYEGHGVFLVRGSTQDVAGVRAAAQRIARDIGPLIQRVDVEVNELPPAQRVRADAMFRSGGLQYVQTADGTKHLFVSAPRVSDTDRDPSVH